MFAAFVYRMYSAGRLSAASFSIALLFNAATISSTVARLLLPREQWATVERFCR